MQSRNYTSKRNSSSFSNSSSSSSFNPSKKYEDKLSYFAEEFKAAVYSLAAENNYPDTFRIEIVGVVNKHQNHNNYMVPEVKDMNMYPRSFAFTSSGSVTRTSNGGYREHCIEFANFFKECIADAASTVGYPNTFKYIVNTSMKLHRSGNYYMFPARDFFVVRAYFDEEPPEEDTFFPTPEILPSPINEEPEVPQYNLDEEFPKLPSKKKLPPKKEDEIEVEVSFTLPTKKLPPPPKKVTPPKEEETAIEVPFTLPTKEASKKVTYVPKSPKKVTSSPPQKITPPKEEEPQYPWDAMDINDNPWKWL